MTQAILVLNAGSSSVKYGVFAAADQSLLAQGLIDRIGSTAEHHADGTTTVLPIAPEAKHAEALAWLTDHLQVRLDDLEIVAAGHRVVHGGQDFTKSAVITPEVIEKIMTLAPLAPAHQPHNLAGIAALKAVWPDIPQVACFDTAFHRTQPRLAQLFAIPRVLSDEGVLRYGFHGLSYDYIASQLPEYLGAQSGRVIVLHLGHGASVCGMKDGKSVATSMGFTALDGLMMGKRSGELDPGVIFYLVRDKGMSIEEAEEIVSSKSGLYGVSGGISSDMRDLAASDDPAAAEAIDLFAYRACRQIGSMASALEGVDAIVFTAGIGENAANVRSKILAGCGWLGVTENAQANQSGGPVISTSDSLVKALVIPTNEEKVIAEQTAMLI
ncbi:acetate/propionate family kinase [Shimia thalassica]|uniref:acetate/propionate family kinase n=1 Tax=Shimia thalassica TaxID=1715693 RepID=UPI0027333313|nr:acetate/propionate family kinase [Shimia thalassica]MDP2520652.1 acetate/propionate family kinase [Shimia thalassica]